MIKLDHEIIQFYIYIIEIFKLIKNSKSLLLGLIVLVEES